MLSARSFGPNARLQFPCRSGPPTGPRPSPAGPAATPASACALALRPPAGRADGAGLPEFAGPFRPPTVPPLLFGPLASNEEQAGREGRGCGCASTARWTRGRERRGHVTAAPASGRPPRQREPSASGRAAARKQLPACKQQLRAHPLSAGAGIPHLRPPSVIAAPACSASQHQLARLSPLLLGLEGKTARG